MKKIQSSAETWIQKGRKVWIKSHSQFPNPYEDAFLEGQILDIQFSKHVKAILIDSKQQIKIPLCDCLKLTYGIKDVADMVDLEQLNQPELLFNIKRRYIQDAIFTYCGPTLLIINPYTKIDTLFNDTILQQYQSYVFTDTLQYKTLAPHIFGLAAFCLWQLFDNQRNQSIVISGQSGAGKTQNTKYCLKFLASLGKNMKQLIYQSHSLRKSKMSTNLRAAQKAIKKTNSKVFGIEQKILGCNQILQAFGNSKTIRNDNSSRFGKLILLVYGQTQIEIKSAFILSYLLQKSRIVSVSQGERNYHIFYYLIKGMSQQQKNKYFLKKSTSDYYYLNQSTTTQISGISDEQRFLEMKKQFLLYLNQDQIQAVLRILSVVLNLGNITFKKIQTLNSGESGAVQNPQYLKVISELLNVPFNQLEHSFQFKTRKMGVSIINSPLKYDEAISLRDSFAKNIYQKTFNYLIKKMNQKIEIEQISLDEDKHSNNYRKSIGLLDIFGFQVLKINSLEQFFINFANQKLQQLYVSYIFKEQQNQFMRQGLKQFSHDIGFQDNKPIIDLFENYPLGVFHLINQSSELNQDDRDLPNSIQKNHSKNIFLKIPKSKRSCFEILHSCSPVSYNTTGFTLKNKDQFPQQLIAILQNTKSESILKICVGDELKQNSQQNQKAAKNAAKKFLGSKFLNSINTLIEELYSCDCHFVRCIKPNSKKSPKLFNSEAVLQSLRYLGVLDSIIIRKLGFIYRRPFKQFYKKFYELDNYIFSFHHDVSKLKTQDDFKKQVEKVIIKYTKKQLDQNNILLGHKKILIRESTLNHLEMLTKEKKKLRISVANRFKSMYKNAIFRTKVKIFLKSINLLKNYMKLLIFDIKDKILNNKVIQIQNVVKKYLWQKRLQKIKQQATKSVTKISAFFKMKRQRKIFLSTKHKIIQVQSNIRLFLTTGKMLRHRYCSKLIKSFFQKSWNIIENSKAVLIQKHWKGFQIRNKFKKDIQNMKKNLRLSKIKSKFKKALFQHNYNKFKQALSLYKNPIIKLQALVRGKYLHRTYNLVRQNTLLIQRVYRKHLNKKIYLSKQWQSYKQVIQENEKRRLQQMQRYKLKLNQKKRNAREIDETSGLLKRMYPSEMLQTYGLNPQSKYDSHNLQKYGYQINQTVLFADKNTFQIYLIDYDSVNNYDNRNQNSYLKKYQNIKNNLKNKMQYIIFLDLTQNSLILVTNKQKIYRINNNGKIQYQEYNSVKSINKIYSSQKGIILQNYQQGKLYQWGIASELLIKSKTQQNKNKIINNDFKNQSLLNYYAKGQTQFIVCSSKIIQRKQFLGQKTIQIMLLTNKIVITQIAASYAFVHFLTNTGNLYSKGSNRQGELGFGFQSLQVKNLTLNEELKKSKQFIESISVGFRHSLAKSKLGYVYGWGDNTFNQLLSNDKFNSKPKKIQHQLKPIKVYQIAAGIKASYFLLQNLKIYGCGASLSFETNENTNLVELALLQQTNSHSRLLSMIKLRCVWNRQYSMVFANAINTSKCKQGSKSDAITKYIKTVAKQWTQNTLYPPYHEFIDNNLNLSDLRKLKFKIKNQSKINKKNQGFKLTKLQQLKMIIDFRKTSSVLKQAAQVKINEFMTYLQTKKEQNWTQQQKNLYQIIKKQFKINLL